MLSVVKQTGDLLLEARKSIEGEGSVELPVLTILDELLLISRI